MKRRSAAVWLAVLAGIAVPAAGCRRAPPPPPPPPEQPRVFPITNTTETVREEDIHVRDADKAVEADFNLDGWRDLALVHSAGQKTNEVAIFIRKAPPVPTADPQRAVYYKAGAIRRVLEGRIIGLASRRRDRFTDLVVILAHTNAPNELLHYKNEGARFVEAGADGVTATP